MSRRRLYIAAAATLVAGLALASDGLVRIEPRPYYGAVVTVEVVGSNRRRPRRRRRARWHSADSRVRIGTLRCSCSFWRARISLTAQVNACQSRGVNSGGVRTAQPNPIQIFFLAP